MQAVILAGGVGTRLRPLTSEIPKSMVQVGGKPILEHTLNILPPKIEEAIFVIGYKGDVIQKYFGDSFRAVKLTYVRQPEPKGTSDALMQARLSLHDGYFLLLSGDDLYHKEDLKRACESSEPVVLVRQSPNPERFGVCNVSEDGRLLRIVEKPKNPESNLVNIGAYLLNHEIFDVPQTRSSNGEFYLAEQVGNWAKKRPVYTVEAQFWQPINNHEELRDAEQLFLKSKTHA